MSNNGICQMRETMQIIYGIESNVDDKDFQYKVKEIDSNEEFESEEERLQVEKDRIEEEKFAKKWSILWKKILEEEKLETFTYTFNNAAIKYERNRHQEPDEYIRIIPESGVIQHFYKDKKTNEAKITELCLHHNPDSSDWKIKYEIEEFKSEKKMILGYECFKMNIVQTRINEKENWEYINKYELFVTDKINLPARLVIFLWEPVTELCALEIKAMDMRVPNSYSIKRAIEIKKEIEEAKLELPKEYADLLIKKNKK